MKNSVLDGCTNSRVLNLLHQTETTTKEKEKEKRKMKNLFR